MFKIKIILLANPIWVNLSWTVFLVAVSNLQSSHPLPPSTTTQCPFLYQFPLHSHYSRKRHNFLWQLLIPLVLYKVPLVIAYFSPKTKGYVIKRVYCIYTMYKIHGCFLLQSEVADTPCLKFYFCRLTNEHTARVLLLGIRNKFRV